MRKQNINIAWATLFALATLSLTGCNDAVNSSVTENQVYIPDGFITKADSKYFEGTDTVTISVPVKMTRKNDERDVKVRLAVTEEALIEFNRRYEKTYAMYPFFRLVSDEVVIRKGTVGAAAELKVVPLTQALDQTGNIFAVPVTLTSADGAGVLNGSETFIYFVRRTPRATVLQFDKGSSASTARHLFLPFNKASWGGGDLVFNAYTMEFLIKFKNDFTAAHNYDLLNPCGDPQKGEIYTRLEGGGNGFSTAAFNVKFNGDNESISGAPAEGLKYDRWYHVAFVFGNSRLQCFVDGMLTTSIDTTLPQLIFPDSLSGFIWGAAAANSGYNGDAGSRATTQSAELRIWTVARTADQIRESMYNVRPDSEGLLGYWKLNDGAGNVVKEHTGKHPSAYMVKYKAAGKYNPNPAPWNLGFTWDTSNQILTVGQ
ncbi:MAG: DUF1735 and LamG domain-containing protein [Rikenellaceae bacterium]|jgi:hypothetical protein|nr:DUF1735 and LamG domain-containing protein [Rikenellaceae bacterium]